MTVDFTDSVNYVFKTILNSQPNTTVFYLKSTRVGQDIDHCQSQYAQSLKGRCIAFFTPHFNDCIF